MLCLANKLLPLAQSHTQSYAICPLYRPPATFLTPVCFWKAEPVHIRKCPPGSRASCSISLVFMFDCTWTLAVWQPYTEVSKHLLSRVNFKL